MFYYRTKIILLLYKSEKVIDSLEVWAKKFTLIYKARETNLLLFSCKGQGLLIY